MRSTVPVALDVDSEDAALLEDSGDTFQWVAQYVVDHAFHAEFVTTSKTALDDETYDDVREKVDGFNGGLVQAARTEAADACKSVVTRRQQAKNASKPKFTSPRVVSDHRTVTVHDDHASLARRTVASKPTVYCPTRTVIRRTRSIRSRTCTKPRIRNCTAATMSGFFTSAARRTWSPTCRIMLTTTPRRILDCDLSVATKPVAMEAHTWSWSWTAGRST